MTRSSQNPVQERSSAIAAFAEELQDHLKQASSSGQLTLPDTLLYTLGQYLEQLPLLSGPVSASSQRLLDARGVVLWNGCTQLISQGEVELKVLSEVRAFAFALLECAASNHKSGNIRVLDVALKAARTSLASEQLSLCLKILGIAATRLDALETSEVDADATRTRSLSTEYYMLRIHLSLLQGRPDIAEHLFSKAPEAKSKEDRKNILETCYRVGKLSLSSGEYETAAKWLGRALDSSDMLSRQPDLDSKDVRLLILHAVVQANTHIDTADSRNQLSRVQETLKIEYENLFPALVIQLEILSKAGSSSCEMYFEALNASIQKMELTDKNINMIICYIQKLRYWSLDLAVEAFKELLLNRLVPSDKRSLIEQCFVSLVWTITEDGTCAQNSIDVITDLTKSLTGSGQGPLSEEAAHASLILIWRAISMITLNDRLPDAQKWCSLILEQPTFQNCSPANKAKFQRKLLSSALDSSDVSLSHQILNYMDLGSRSDPLTLYSMYKLTLLSGSHLGSESLDKLWALDKKHLLSCAAEAQRLGKMRQAIDIFQGIIANLDGCDKCVNVAGLFQSTICLLSREMERGNKDTDTHKLLEEVCTVFETALCKADKQELSRENISFSQDDLGWLFHSAYTLALKSVDVPEPEYITRLLDISGKFATLYQHHLKPEHKSEMDSHHLLCNFLKALRLVSEARKQSDPTKKATNYQIVRHTVHAFRSQIQYQLREKSNTAKERTDWIVKYRTMLAFDFEAAIHLGQWIDLPSLIEEAKPIATDKLCCIFLDSILSSEAPIREILCVVKTIICTNHKTIPTKLPRYLHILFQLSLSPSAGDAENITVAESVLDQILALARKSNTKPNPKITQSATPATARSYYPNDELEWLATTAFNRAVDFYRDAADADCLRWAGKAIEVAELVRGDGEGVLVGLLRRNLGVLGIT